MTKPPAADELEVSVFGPGIGECVVLHLGDGEWVVVDSCIERRSKLPVALGYLESVGVEVASSVKQIVVTHWHDDHIGGAAALFERCTSAELVLSSALRSKEFYRHIAASQKMPDDKLGVSELSRLLEIVQRRKPGRAMAKSPRWVMADQLLLRSRHAELHSLSPSSATFNLALHEIAEALPKPDGSRRRLVSLMPNQTAVVLWIRAGERIVLLGSDLETGTHPEVGWNAIMSSTTRPLGKAQLFKVAHHGSPNADHEGIWTNLLAIAPVAIVTPFSAGPTPRPAPSDLERLVSRADQLFVTAQPGGKKDKSRAKLERFAGIREHGVRDLKGEMGHVRLRAGPDATWTAETLGAAFRYEHEAS